MVESESRKPAEFYRDDAPSRIPTLHLGYKSKSASTDVDRFERKQKRQQQRQGHYHNVHADDSDDTTDSDASVSDVEGDADYGLDEVASDLQQSVAQEVHTDFTISYLEAMESELQILRTENLTLRMKLNAATMSDDSFFCNEDGSRDDEKVKYYTGLPSFLTLAALVSFLTPHISSGPRSITSKFQQVLIVLTRLRLNLPGHVVADLFRISDNSVSRIFLKVLDVMYVRMMPLISWPDRESLRRTMPFNFKPDFGNKVTVIETPSNLLARAQTWSSYKHHNTIKYLIGITPQGVVSFISEGWGGRTSDKWVTENSTFLDNLLPGDLVLADRGFNINDSVGLMCAEVRIPAFIKGKKQLSAFDVESTRKIAHVRIHVERVIGNIIQKYAIIDSTIPITMLTCAEGATTTTLDQIVTVSCALVTICPSVVPFD
ncbi:uncharacterized protein [Littorina saxatilis]|uniref:uncharacterized protein n=1 Tax=Littorina saxatilis TaxID=31220 RepID=UPI0038B62024